MTHDTEEYPELVDPTVDMESPFQPAPLGDTVVMEHSWTPQDGDCTS